MSFAPPHKFGMDVRAPVWIRLAAFIQFSEKVNFTLQRQQHFCTFPTTPAARLPAERGACDFLLFFRQQGDNVECHF